MGARGRKTVLLERTSHRTSPPPSTPLGPVDDDGDDLTHNTDTSTANTPPATPHTLLISPAVEPGAGDGLVAVSQSTAPDVVVAVAVTAIKRGGPASTSDEHMANHTSTTSPRVRCPPQPVNAPPSPPPAAAIYGRRAQRAGTSTYIHSHSHSHSHSRSHSHSHPSPLRPPARDDAAGLASCTGPEPISAADAALIEASNHTFFTRHRAHEAAVAHQAACDIALERVRQHRRLGTRADDWDEELALEGLPPLQRWERRPGPGEGLEEKENWSH